MSGNNWLADEINAQHRGFGRYIIVVVSVIIVTAGVGYGVIRQMTESKLAPASTVLQASSDSSDGLPNSHPPTSASTPKKNGSSTVAPQHITPNTPTPVVNIQPVKPNVDCNALDKQYRAPYDIWASGTFSDLATYESQVIPDAGTLGTYTILSDINQEIQKVDNQSVKNFYTYTSPVQQQYCLTSLNAAYWIPTCVDLTQCIGQIPTIPQT